MGALLKARIISGLTHQRVSLPRMAFQAKGCRSNIPMHTAFAGPGRSVAASPRNN